MSRHKKHGPPTTTTHVEIERAWCFPGDSARRAQLPHGATDLRLVVQRCVAIPLHHELATPDLVAIDFSLAPASRKGLWTTIEIDCRKRILQVPTGSWHLVAHVRVHELARWSDLRTDVRDDPRLTSFDWRSFARLVEVRVVDPAGRPRDDCSVKVRGRDTRCVPNNGIVRVLVPHDGADIMIEPNDARLAKSTLRAVARDQDVVLGGVPVTVTLQPMPKLPPDVQLLIAIDEGDFSTFDANGVATASALTAGSFEAAIRVRRQESFPEALDWQLPRIDVPKGGTQVAVPVTPARQQALEALIASLRDR